MTDKKTEEATTAVVKFSITEAGIAELIEQYGKPVKPTDEDSYDAMKVDMRAVAKVRTAVDKERKTQNATALAHQRNVNKIGNGIIERIEAIEAPMKKMIQDIDDAEATRIAEAEEAESERLEKINGRLERIAGFGVVSISDTLERVQKRLKLMNDLNPNEGFDEFAGKAGKLREAGIKALTEAESLLMTRAETEEKAAEAQKIIDDAAADKQKKDDDDAAAQKVIDDEKAADDAKERSEEQARLRELEDQERDRQKKEDDKKEAARKLKSAPDREKLLVFAQTIAEIEMPDLDNDVTNTCYRVSHQLRTIAGEIEADSGKI